MKIISHRGFWTNKNQQNSILSFRHSFDYDFGIETDLRDFNGEIVISHDLPNENSIKFTELLELISTYTNKSKLTLALNIKSDGLATHVKKKLIDYSDLNYFFFDMSIPDMRSYYDIELPIFTRVSEYEQNSRLIDESIGIWLDSFESNWYDENILEQYLCTGKKICVVSSELHKREYMNLWKLLYPFKNDSNLILCTDFPNIASEYFKNSNNS